MRSQDDAKDVRVVLEVGYEGRTRSGQKVAIVEYDAIKVYPYMSDCGDRYTSSGHVNGYGRPNQMDILGPWSDVPEPTPPIVPDYNNGEWWGWNGGECPVHPETLVDPLIRRECAARTIDWKAFRGGFRVTVPYVREPMDLWVEMNSPESVCAVHTTPTRTWSGTTLVHFREVISE